MIQIGVRVVMQGRSLTYGTGANMILFPVMPDAQLALLVRAFDDTITGVHSSQDQTCLV